MRSGQDLFILLCLFFMFDVDMMYEILALLIQDTTPFHLSRILEQNEDIIAAIVENMQLGRMDDCIQHYSILHKNIISLALALDNFPAGEHSRLPYKDINKFPDEIMRKDILDELRPLGQTKLPQAPAIPACLECNNKSFSAHKCRVELGHIEPSSAFSSSEVQEFLKVAQLLEFRGKTEVEPAKAKRVYRVWSPAERFSVLLGISRHGMKGANLLKILEMLPSRNEGQLRSYISKNLSEGEVASALRGVLPPEPEKYVYPPGYAPGSSPHSHGGGAGGEGSGADTMMGGYGHHAGFLGAEAADGQFRVWQQASSAGQGASRLEPGRGTGDWTALLGIVDGQGGVHVPMPVYSAGVASVGPVVPNYLPPHVHALSHVALQQPQRPGVGALLPSISAALLPPPPFTLAHLQQSVPPPLQLHQAASQVDNATAAAKKRKYVTKQAVAASNGEPVPPSSKLGKKRGKYKKKDRGEAAADPAAGSAAQVDGISGGGTATGGDNVAVVTAPPAAAVSGSLSGVAPSSSNNNPKISTEPWTVASLNEAHDKDGGIRVPVVLDENSMYMPALSPFSSPQSRGGPRHRLDMLHQDSSVKPQDIIFDSFSQFSFDWENSQSGSPYRGHAPQGTSTSPAAAPAPSARSRLALASPGGKAAPAGEHSRGGLQDTSDFDPDGEGFSNLLQPGDATLTSP